MSATVSNPRTYLMLGKCLRSSLRKAAKVCVTTLELDKYLLMHFPEKKEYYALDPEERCRPGDIVLIKRLPEPVSLKIEHKVVKIVYPYGRVVDPISGRRCFGSKFVDDVDRLSDLFNEIPPYKKHLLDSNEEEKS